MIAAVVLLGGATAAADPSTGSSTKLLYRWVDAEGRVHFSDRVPPEAVHQQYSEVDGNGRVRKLVAREKTAGEAADEARNARLSEQQASRDHYLLQTYANADDLQRDRSAQLQVLEQRRAAAQKALAENRATLDDLRSRSASADADGADAVEKLQQQINSFELSGRQTDDTLNQIDAERRATLARFDADSQRYDVLTRASIATH